MISPDGHELTYALRFEFKASNNEAEYEALIAGLKLALKMGVTKLRAYSDSQLVVNQVMGGYAAKDLMMKRYLQKVQDLMAEFEEFTIDRIPRSQNKRADALSKLASSAYAHLTRKVLVEVLAGRSIIDEHHVNIIS